MKRVEGNNQIVCRIEKDFSKYFSTVADFLYQEEGINSLMLGILENFKKGITSYKELALQSYLAKMDSNEIRGVALQTPNNYLVLSHFHELGDVSEVVEEFCRLHLTFPGVVGPAAVVRKFLEDWGRVTGKGSRIGMNQMIYQLRSVQHPQVIGQARWANDQDLKLVGKWLFDFVEESLPPPEHRPLSERVEQAQRMIAAKNVMLWEVNGEPVSMAHKSRETLNGNSINAVFTPKELRGRGYASGIVAAISQYALDQGKQFCVLYTDLSNPTSNKIYKKIGYQEIGESTQAFIDE